MQNGSFGGGKVIVELGFNREGAGVKTEAKENKSEGETNKYITDIIRTEHKNLKKDKQKKT